MRIETNVTCAAWIRPRLGPFGGTVSSVVPTGFEAYARVLHPVGLLEGAGTLRWEQVARKTGRRLHALAQFWRIAGRTEHRAVETGWPEGSPRLGELDRATQIQLIASIAAYDCRYSSVECVAAVWRGKGYLRGHSELENAPTLQLPHRDYVLFRGVLSELEGFDINVPVIGSTERRLWVHVTPALLWPTDTAWCVATEVDFDSTLVGGPRALIDTVLKNAQLEAFEVAPGDSLLFDADRVNVPESGE